MKKAAHFVNHCIPLQAKALHIFCGRNQSLLTFALPAYKHMLGKNLRLRMVVHGGNGSSYLSNLKEYGLSAEKVRLILGASYSEKEFSEWLDATRAIENTCSVPG